MCDAAPGIVFMLDRMGVPFNRTPEGLLDFRRFGGTLFHRTAFAGATTGQQLLYALDEQVRRWETVDVEDDKGERVPGEKMVRKLEFWDFLAPRARRRRASAAASSRRTSRRWPIEAFPGDAVCLATGGCGIVFGAIDQQRHQHRHRRERRLPAGRLLRERRVHPGPPDGDPRRRQAAPHLGERARRGRPRLGAAGPEGAARRARRARERSATTSSRRSTPATATSSRATSRAASSSRSASTRSAASSTPTSGKNENEVYLDVTHLPQEVLRKKLAGVLEIYEKFVGEDPYTNPMRVFPAVHYSMGGLWVDFERARERVARRWARRATRRRTSRASTRSARSTTSTTAPTASAPTRSSRASAAGMVDGPRDRGVPQEPRARARGTCRRRSSTRRRSASEKKFEAILAMDGDENPYALHDELAQTMLVDCTIERHNADARRGAREGRGDRRALAQARRRDRHGDRAR